MHDFLKSCHTYTLTQSEWYLKKNSCIWVHFKLKLSFPNWNNQKTKPDENVRHHYFILVMKSKYHFSRSVYRPSKQNFLPNLFTAASRSFPVGVPLTICLSNLRRMLYLISQYDVHSCVMWKDQRECGNNASFIPIKGDP